MAVAQLAVAWYIHQQQIARRAAELAEAAWQADADPADLEGSWIPAAAVLAATIGDGQHTAALGASGYVASVAADAGVDPAPAGVFAPESLAGVASDGRDLVSLLEVPARQVEYAQAVGVARPDSMLFGQRSLLQIVTTQIQDAGRVAVGVASTNARGIEGYVRTLTPPSCSRCAILAGRVYRWNQGFQRHPKCDCTMHPVPAGTRPQVQTARQYFDSLDRAEQDRIFTQAGAQAIRDGGDPAQVVNARRGALGLSPAGARITEQERQTLAGTRGRLQPTTIGGRQVFITREATTRRGEAGQLLEQRSGAVRQPGERVARARSPRLMPESIYQIAGEDRAEAIRLLKANGYIR